ncbi:MAG: translation initiation factor IF-2 [Bacteroidota bacterium]|nr:translation initiation factor IF-2 [Bacteroidota bacterium]
MSIRLSKACKDLNVGMTTAVEFLAKKGHKIVVDPNLKLSDDLHLLLAKEFNKDMALKIESERLSQERLLKEKAPSVAIEGYNKPKPVEKPAETIHVSISEDQLPHFKSVGHIDLDKKEKHAEVKQEVKAHAPAIEKTVIEKPANVTSATEKTLEEKTTPVEKAIEEKEIVKKEVPAEIVHPIKEESKKEVEASVSKPEQESTVEEKTILAEPVKIEPKEEKITKKEHRISHEPKVDLVRPVKKFEISAEPEIEPAEKNTETRDNDHEEDEIFTLGIPTIDIAPVVIGTIDLDLLNQSTRPKPKTKEQKRREREDKSKQLIENKKSSFDGEKKVLRTAAEVAANPTPVHPKKKRERFSNQKVDITKVPQPNGPTQGFAHPKKVTPGTTGGGGAVKSNKDRLKKSIKTVVNEEDVQKQIKETLARLSGANKKGKGSKYRRDKRDSVSARQQEQAQRERDEESVIKLTEFVTASELAVMMDVSVNQVIATCMNIGLMVSINQRLDAETINIVAEEFGFTTEYVSHDVVEAIGEEEVDTETDLLPRAPVVAVMGHVDHGKTSLLDYIRKTNVIAGEAGGITQHIGAYNVKLENGQRITFLDTPGHEAFTAMRARGAKATDIAIIIVAADDNVMPQTIEAINHAAAANVSIIFAINKVDKPGANPEKIKETLAQMNYLVEDWGGKYQSQDISAKKGDGVAELLEKVLLEAEILELKANPNKRAIGSVIESTLDKGRGYVSTILVQNGTLHVGDVVLAGINHGKIKAMFNERNQRIKEVKPGEPALILGLNGAPQAGDNFNVMNSEHEAREIANKREQLQREQSIRTKKHFTLDELGRRIALGDFKELNIIVKGDVDGSVEALSDSLLNLSTENIQVNVIHKAVGAISDSDILLAAASNAIICGFQVRPTSTARKMAEKEEIDIRLYSIIYDAIEEIKSAMEGMLSPEIKEEITATVEIREVFKITKVGTVAGCLVREGKIKRTNKVRIIRDGIVVYTGELDSLKRFKDDVKEVGTNYECGLNIKNYNDIQVGDIVESFEETEVRKTL